MRGIWYGVLQGSLEGGVGKLFLQMSKWFTPSYLCAAFHLYWWKTDKNKQMKEQHQGSYQHRTRESSGLFPCQKNMF